LWSSAYYVPVTPPTTLSIHKTQISLPRASSPLALLLPMISSASGSARLSDEVALLQLRLKACFGKPKFSLTSCALRLWIVAPAQTFLLRNAGRCALERINFCRRIVQNSIAAVTSSWQHSIAEAVLTLCSRRCHSRMTQRIFDIIAAVNILRAISKANVYFHVQNMYILVGRLFDSISGSGILQKREV
jgi:hypothetical protein